jgi:putative spermidine/putrescine transport system permease protein
MSLNLDRVWSILYGFGVVAGIVFLLAPITMILMISLSAAPSVVFPPPSFTFAQYAQIPDALFAAFQRSLYLGIVVIAVDLVICVPAAFALARGSFPLRPLVEAFFRSPLQIPGVVLAVGFFLYYSQLLKLTGISLRNDFNGLVIAHVVMTAPYMLTAVAVRLSTINRHLEAASYGLGAGFFRTQWRVVFPQLKPAVLTGCFLSFVISFEDVPVTLFLSPGASSTTLPVALFNLAIDSLSPALFAAAILVLLFSFFLVIALEFLVGIRRVVSGV